MMPGPKPGPGLARKIAAREFPHECVFCGYAMRYRPPNVAGRKPICCGDPECLQAYNRCWRRDAVRKQREASQPRLFEATP